MSHFSVGVLTTIYFIEHKLAWEKKDPKVVLINDNRRIKVNDYRKLMIIVCHFFHFNWVCNWGKVTTQYRWAILGNG